MGVTPKWMVFFHGKSKTKMDEIWKKTPWLGKPPPGYCSNPRRVNGRFYLRFLDVFPKDGNPVSHSSYGFPWVHTCGSRTRSLSAWTTIRPRTSWDSPRIDNSWWFNVFFWDLTKQYITLYNNLGISLGYFSPTEYDGQLRWIPLICSENLPMFL